MQRTIKLSLSFAALAGGTLLGLHVFGATTPMPAAAPPPAPVPVVTAAVQQHDVPIVVSGLGTVQALNAATIRSQVTGLLQTVDFTEGQAVHRGDVLAQIDPRPYRARLAQAQAQLTRDRAQLANAQVNLGRNMPLLKSGFATDQQVTNERYQIAQLQGAIQSDQAAIDDARTQLGYTTLTAPFDGITGVRTLDVGNIIHPTDANGLVAITQVQPISVLFTLPAADIGTVQAALAAGPVPTIAYDQSGQAVLDRGQLLLVNNLANPTSGTVTLKALFPNLQRHLWPGTFVDIELTVSVAKQALTVPVTAVQLGTQGNFAFVVGADGKAVVQRVQVGQRHRGQAIITSGLQPGETVVTQGQYRLTAGTPVASAPPSQVADSSTATAGMLP